MTAGKACQRHPPAGPETEPGERLVGVVRAGRQVAAMEADQRRERIAVGLDQDTANEPRRPGEPRPDRNVSDFFDSPHRLGCFHLPRQRLGRRPNKTGRSSNQSGVPLDQNPGRPAARPGRCSAVTVGTGMRRGALVILMLLAWPAWASAQTPARPAAGSTAPVPLAAPAGAAPANARPEQTDSVQFEWVREGGDCRNRCRAWVAASGRLTETSAADFEAFIQGLDLRGAMVVLDSPGGVVEAGLALGRAFRRLGLATTVGRTIR